MKSTSLTKSFSRVHIYSVSTRSRQAKGRRIDQGNALFSLSQLQHQAGKFLHISCRIYIVYSIITIFAIATHFLFVSLNALSARFHKFCNGCGRIRFAPGISCALLCVLSRLFFMRLWIWGKESSHYHFSQFVVLYFSSFVSHPSTHRGEILSCNLLGRMGTARLRLLFGHYSYNRRFGRLCPVVQRSENRMHLLHLRRRSHDRFVVG